MGRINRLPAGLANQIAAGEVVERPAAAVKELVENALDAGAVRVAVTLELGGKRLIRVEDDGEGMAPDDAELAVERHATSKIGALGDLAAIATLGFRGEALPSIASVSHLRLRTRARGASSGVEVAVDGGDGARVTAAGLPEGTAVEVRDLFYNVPARRKFLKSDGAETGHVSRALTQLALAHAAVGFRLRSGPRTLFDYPPVEAFADRFFQIYGDRPGLVAVRKEAAGIRLSGLAAALAADGPVRGPQHLFVNRRAVKDRTILHAVNDASFSQAMADAASAADTGGAMATGGDAPRRLRGVLPEVETPLRTGEVALDDLLRFAAGPVEFFFRNRLRMTLRLEDDAMRDDEPLVLDGLQTWQVRNRLLAMEQAGLSDAAAVPILLAKGELQQSNLGRVECRERTLEVAQLADALAPYREHLDAPPLDVDVQVGDICLSGAVAGCHGDELVAHRVGRLRSKDYIDAWLRLLCLVCTVERPMRAVLLGVGQDVERLQIQGPDANTARCLLAQWFKAWARGWRAPLPFFPDTSWEWIAGGPYDAHQAWVANAYGDGQNSYNRLAFPESPLGDEAFETLAEELLGPLAAAIA